MIASHRRLVALSIILLIASLSGSLTASVGDDLRLVLASERPGATPEDGRVRIELEPEAYKRLWRSGRAVIESFPLPDGQRVDLDVRPFQLLTHDAVVVAVDASGERTVAPPNIRFVRGSVVGDVDSLVVLGLFENRISGNIRTRDGSFGVGAQQISLSAPEALDLQVWSRELEQGETSCSLTDEESAKAVSALQPLPDLGDPLLPSAIGGPQLLIELALDSTTEWCAQFGDNATDAQNYMLSVVAQVSAIYEAEVSLLVQVPYIRTHCGVADPYTDGLGVDDRSLFLDEVEAEWSTNQGAVSRTVAHAFSVSDVPFVSAGLAGTVSCTAPGVCTPALCNTDIGYAVNLLPATGGTPSTSEVSVAAHELGHNHSSPHTNCLQDGGGNWISTCTIDTCPLNPACFATGCFPGPADTNMTGTLMSTGCDAEDQLMDDIVVESIIRGAAESASCVGAAGLPGKSLGLMLSRPTNCSAQSFVSDDGGLETAASGPDVWAKRFSPGCTPFQLESVETIVPDFGASAGDPLRILIYVDPSGSGDPSNATLAYTEDVTIQTVSFSVFNQYTLATPVVVTSGDIYIGFFDPLGNVNALASLDDSSSGDSYLSSSTDPAAFSLLSGLTFMIRGNGSPVPAGTFGLAWDPPCNDATTPGQDYAIYRGTIGTPGVYTNLACTTDFERSYFAVGQPDNTFYLVVPNTTPSEGSYGRTSAGIERPAAAGSPCKIQNLEACPLGR